MDGGELICGWYQQDWRLKRERDIYKVCNIWNGGVTEQGHKLPRVMTECKPIYNIETTENSITENFTKPRRTKLLQAIWKKAGNSKILVDIEWHQKASCYRG